MNEYWPLGEKVAREAANKRFLRLPDGWREFKEFLGAERAREFLCLIKPERVEVAVATEELLVTLLVDDKHYMVTAVALGHVKGVEFADHQGSVRKGSEVQLNVWFLDNTRFYWESGPEEVDQMRRFALYLRGRLGRPKAIPVPPD